MKDSLAQLTEYMRLHVEFKDIFVNVSITLYFVSVWVLSQTLPDQLQESWLSELYENRQNLK